ncbi:MAG: RNA-binding S4 domain-containing protein [Bacteroidales bacterium]|mgnify:CR=1 FL=1|jgi:ribosome-associated protein|nr:RNA-binding S4 domain-containing protein [Bacteroidales bacterium]
MKPIVVDFTLKSGEDFIPLIQLLKVANVVGSGGEAQGLVMQGLVQLNAQPESRKRAKIRSGDVVTTGPYTIKVH